METSQKAKADAFRASHADGVLVLPNAWDAGSAAVIAHAGARAIATTSGGVSWTAARPDGQGLSRDDMAALVGRIAAAVDLPVTADVEGGYGPAPADVAATVRAVVAAGAVGINLEDNDGGPLFTAEDQAARLRAAREAAADAGLPELVVNVRTDVYLFQVGAPEGRFDEVVARAKAYADAGADCLFVPGLTDLDTLAALVRAVSLPVNAMAGPGAPAVRELAAAGVRRVSLGTSVAQAAYAVAHRATVEALSSGTYSAVEDSLDYSTLNGMFSGHQR
ncbi:isocitrate lyase/phosphoenolpyruvate mutase family protein [Actinokineospora soli]|uniref:Isocitrate lyase/phosphoenolpyruvate mutase family protein n=1 Tax=Actinokineospora soli TaxID=1048753 RepID=A0ABW2TJZ8_9PSEU